MKHQSILGLGVLVGLTMLLSCSDVPPTGTPEESSPPAIQSLRVSPLNVIGGSTVVATAEVTGPEGVPSEFEWSVTGGQIIGATIGSEVTWITPQLGRTATISCKVRNDCGDDELTSRIFLVSADIPTTHHVYDLAPAGTIPIHSVFPTMDGGCLTLGRGSSSCWLAKFTRDGEVAWDQAIFTFDNGLYYPPFAARQLQDGGFIILGFEEYREYDYSAFIYRIDKSGEPVWRTEMLNQRHLFGLSVLEDGGCVFLSRGQRGLNLTKLNLKGETDRQSLITPPASLGGTSCYLDQTLATSDGGFIVWGLDTYEDLETFPMNSGMMKFSADGELEWTKTFGQSGNEWIELRDVMDSRSGYLVVAAAEWSRTNYPIRDDKLLLMGIDYSGNVYWSKNYPEIVAVKAVINEFENGSIGVGAYGNDGEYRFCNFDGGGDYLWMVEDELENLYASNVYDIWQASDYYRMVVTAYGDHMSYHKFMVALDRTKEE